MPENQLVRKVVLDKKGAADVLQVSSHEMSFEVGQDEILIEVAFSGLNFADVLMRLGLYQDAPAMPFVPGYEVSGKVLKKGRNVSHLNIGDRVWSGCLFGGYASHIKVKARQALKLADDLSLEAGAALPVNLATAHLLLVNQARIKKNDRVLVDCASGGVGGLAIEIIKLYGGKAVGLTSSQSKIQHLKDIGYNPCTHREFKEKYQYEKFDVILNSRGGKSVADDFKRLSPNGKLIVFGISDAVKNGKRSILQLLKLLWQMPRYSFVTLMNQNKSVAGLNALKIFEDSKALEKLMKELVIYNIEPKVDHIFPAGNVDQAHHYLESRQSKGKVLLSWQ